MYTYTWAGSSLWGEIGLALNEDILPGIDEKVYGSIHSDRTIIAKRSAIQCFNYVVCHYDDVIVAVN
jgi:hypothetical protein